MNCVDHYDFEDIFGFIIAVLNLLLIGLVLLVSFHIKTSEISRVFTIFLFCSCVPSEFFSLVYDTLRCGGYANVELTHYPSINWLYVFYKVTRSMAQSQYEFLSLVMAYISYSLFANPTRFNHFFGRGQAIYYLSGISLLSFFLSCLCVFLNVASDPRGEWWHIGLEFLYYLFQASILVPFILMVSFYVKSCIAIYRYQKTPIHFKAEKDRKTQLISVLVYCTPPNLLNLVVIGESTLSKSGNWPPFQEFVSASSNQKSSKRNRLNFTALFARPSDQTLFFDALHFRRLRKLPKLRNFEVLAEGFEFDQGPSARFAIQDTHRVWTRI
ncbi:hypothetical protein L596_008462 [Steinernema carpocapsae]|uniref:G-protein coupled receptors family 1 profile domain-containing protein n=1 Tax=Steinernema carpocapsae TaxID=34508 RepID=A0A4V6A6F4_STECR|nr:hypothetical protein L596_008462 [Steinernema carpocapsae]